MALHLYQSHFSKPPPFPLANLPSLLGLRCSTTVPRLHLGFNGLRCLQNPSLHLRPTFVKSSNSLSLSTPPSSREDAISQAKTCLSATLQRSLKGIVSFPSKKIKKQKQPRYRVEIPVIDDSPESVVQLAFEVFSDLNIKIKDSKPTMLLVWPSPALEEIANQAFGRSRNTVIHSKLGSITDDFLNSSNLAVVVAPGESQLEEISTLVDELDPKPVILFNPKWAFEEEKDFSRHLIPFVASFDVVYSFTGLEVQGILSRRRGVVLRCVRDGKASGEPWLVMVQEGDKGEMKVITRFTKRPSIVEVETVLYNLMAANSPLTKSIKSVSDFVRNATKKFT